MLRYLTPVIAAAIFVPGLAQDRSSAKPEKLSAVQQEKADRLLEQLGSSNFKERREAADKLAGLGKSVIPMLKRAIDKSSDPELRWQARRVLRKLEGGGESKLERDSSKRRAPRTDDFGLPTFGQGNSVSQSIKIEMSPDGVRVETRDAKGGKDGRKVYEAPDMESLLKKHPELKDKVSGLSSKRGMGGFGRDFPGFGKDLRDHLERAFGKDMQLPGLRGFDWDLDFDSKLPEHTPEQLQERVRKMLEGFDLQIGKMRGQPFRFRFGRPGAMRDGRGNREDAPERDERGSGKLEKVERRSPTRSGDDGPKLGVYVRGELPASIRDFLGLEDGVGLRVDSVAKDSLAKKAGLRSGDVVTHLNGRKIGSPSDVQRALRTAKETVKVDWIRKGHRKSTTVRK